MIAENEPDIIFVFLLENGVILLPLFSKIPTFQLMLGNDIKIKRKIQIFFHIFHCLYVLLINVDHGVPNNHISTA